jgi:hypothetical protein
MGMCGDAPLGDDRCMHARDNGWIDFRNVVSRAGEGGEGNRLIGLHATVDRRCEIIGPKKIQYYWKVSAGTT